MILIRMAATIVKLSMFVPAIESPLISVVESENTCYLLKGKGIDYESTTSDTH
jgi:hypothetical protein